MHATASTLPTATRRFAAFALAFGLAGAGLRADTKDTDAFPTFDSYIKVSGQAPSITGNGAAYAERAHSPESGAYGIHHAWGSWKERTFAHYLKKAARLFDKTK